MSRLYVSGRLVGMDKRELRNLLLHKGYIRSGAKSEYGEIYINLSHSLNINIEAVVLKQDPVGVQITLEVDTQIRHTTNESTMFFHAFMRDILQEKLIEKDVLAEYCNQRIKSIRSFFDMGIDLEATLVVCGALALMMAFLVPHVGGLSSLQVVADNAIMLALFVFSIAGCSCVIRVKNRHAFLLDRKQPSSFEKTRAIAASFVLAVAMTAIGGQMTASDSNDVGAQMADTTIVSETIAIAD